MSSNDTAPVSTYTLTYSIKFAVLMALEIPSILVSLLIFIYFGTSRAARSMDQNHSILVLLAINFLQVTTDLPVPMSFFQTNGHVQPATSAFCTWWTWYEFSLNTVNGHLMAWICIERYIVIFHSNFVRNLAAWKRRVFHFAPLALCTSWGPTYYTLTIIITPMCENMRFYDSLLCGLPCYLFTNWGTFDLFCDVIAPVLTIFIFNLALFVRAVYQSMMVVGRVQNSWHRHRKMALQLGLISFLYLSVWLPLSVIQLGLIYISPTFLLDYLDTFNYLVYIVPLLLPMMCLLSMPELIRKVKAIVLKRPRMAVVPLSNTGFRPIDPNRRSTVTAGLRI